MSQEKIKKFRKFCKKCELPTSQIFVIFEDRTIEICCVCYEHITTVPGSGGNLKN